jgi:hypothetical protein
VEDLRKNLRDRKQEQENFEPKRRDLIKKAEDHEKRVRLIQDVHFKIDTPYLISALIYRF